MNKIDIYIIKKFLGTFFLAISLIIVIVIVFDISENIDDLIQSDAPLNEIIFVYYLNFIPYFVNLFSPLFTFIAVIYFTSKMASRSEIVAILGSGVSFARMLRPYLITACFLTGLAFYLANFLIPHTNINLLNFKNTYIKNKYRNDNQNIHMQIAPGAFVYVESYNVDENKGSRFTIEHFNNGVLYYKMEAKNIVWDSIKQKWTINDYSIHLIDGLKEKILTGAKKDTAINLTPKDFYKRLDNLDVMNFSQLRKFIKDERLKGSENIRFYEMEKHKRLAFPFSTFILTLIAVSVSSRKVRGGIGIHIAFGMALTFLYILLMRITETFATYGNLAPVLAAWLPNVLFAGIALYMIIKAPK
ncbi:MAG TPA: LptF/LptG family permease [Bacteroidales bacterium]|nr:LptF/LptG family permease [Bacteroidales bacterium]